MEDPRQHSNNTNKYNNINTKGFVHFILTQTVKHIKSDKVHCKVDLYSFRMGHSYETIIRYQRHTHHHGSP